MNVLLLTHELTLIVLGLGVLLADLWLPAERKRGLGYLAAAGVGALLLYSLLRIVPSTEPAFKGMFLLDGTALFLKRFFLVATILVLLMAVEFSDRITAGISEYYSLILFAAAGMMFAASANDFALLFVSLELITVTFYVLVSFQRGRAGSLEAGVKYLIMGALSSAFMVFGIAFIYGTGGSFNFGDLAAAGPTLVENKLFLFGLLFLLVGLGFKIAVVPFQMWAPDVYQGAPTPTTAFLAVGSKAAGFVLLLRVLFTAVPLVAQKWSWLFVVIAAATILYGNLCALPQTNLKRLLGYSSISHAGYLLLGIAAMAAMTGSRDGGAAILYYLAGYLFTVLAAFMVITLVLRETGAEDIEGLNGLHQRSPLLAAALTMAMVSLAGIPPLAGFFGKFLLIKSALAVGATHQSFYALVAIALVGVVISLYYYFGVVRAIYWGGEAKDKTELTLSLPARATVFVCLAGILFIGIYQNPLIKAAELAVQALR